MDNFEIDSHKLAYHPERVAEWRQSYKNWETAKSVYPIYVEVSPNGACNHRCTFCAKDYVGYVNIQIEPGVLKNSLSEMASLGVKSVMFAGEGEPTLYKFLPDVLGHCSEIGIDTSLTTNMVPFNRDNIEVFLNCAWIKVSINAGTADTYSKIHQCKPSDFDRVLKNFEMALEIRDKKGHSCTLGAQMILLTDNAKEAYLLGERLKRMGADYLVIKPYSQHPKSSNRSFEDIDYENFVGLENDLKKLNDDKFSLIFRGNTINRAITKKHEFSTCHAVPFFSAHVMANGEVYGCADYLEDERFLYGNIEKQSFKEIWEGEKRRENHRFVMEDLNIEDCRLNCRLSTINGYLWNLSHPGKHVNFI